MVPIGKPASIKTPITIEPALCEPAAPAASAMWSPTTAPKIVATAAMALQSEFSLAALAKTSITSTPMAPYIHAIVRWILSVTSAGRDGEFFGFHSVGEVMCPLPGCLVCAA